MAADEHPTLVVARAKEKGDLAALLDLLISTERTGRLAAANALGEMGDARAVQPLIQCLQSSDWILRSGALKALAKIGDRKATDAIASVGLGDESIPVRTEAASSLQRLGDPRAADVLQAILEAEPGDARYRRWAANKLVEINGVAALPALEQAAQRGSPRERWTMRRRVRRLQAEQSRSRDR